jgi:hypothetical protein
MNGTFNDRIISEENKKISLYSHYLKTLKKYIHWLIEDLGKLYLFMKAIIQVWRNCQILSEQTSDSSALYLLTFHIQSAHIGTLKVNSSCPKYTYSCIQAAKHH